VLAYLEEQGSVGARRKWPPRGFPRGAAAAARAAPRLTAGPQVQSGGVGEEAPAGSEAERTEHRQAPGGGHEDQPDVSGHPRRGANGPEGEAQPAGEDPEADHGAHLLLQVPYTNHPISMHTSGAYNYDTNSWLVLPSPSTMQSPDTCDTFLEVVWHVSCREQRGLYPLTLKRRHVLNCVSLALSDQKKKDFRVKKTTKRTISS